MDILGVAKCLEVLLKLEWEHGFVSKKKAISFFYPRQLEQCFSAFFHTTVMHIQHPELHRVKVRAQMTLLLNEAPRSCPAVPRIGILLVGKLCTRPWETDERWPNQRLQPWTSNLEGMIPRFRVSWRLSPRLSYTHRCKMQQFVFYFGGTLPGCPGPLDA